MENVWAWGKVKRWHEHTRTLQFHRHLPAYQSMADFRNANRGKNTKAVTPLDLMPSVFVPESIRQEQATPGNGNKWTAAVVSSFTLLVRRGKAGNALLNALHISDLRASGYKG